MAQLTDFGLSKVMDDMSHEIPGLLLDETSTANRGGAMRWLAPELLGLDESDDDDNPFRPPLTRETDVYSYSMVMIEVFARFFIWIQSILIHRLIRSLPGQGPSILSQTIRQL